MRETSLRNAAARVVAVYAHLGAVQLCGMLDAIASPRPVPPVSFERLSSTQKKRSNTFSRSSGGMPTPVSQRARMGAPRLSRETSTVHAPAFHVVADRVFHQVARHLFEHARIAPEPRCRPRPSCSGRARPTTLRRSAAGRRQDDTVACATWASETSWSIATGALSADACASSRRDRVSSSSTRRLHMLGFSVDEPGELLHIFGAGYAAVDDLGIPGNNRERRLELMRYVRRESAPLRHLGVDALRFSSRRSIRGTISCGTLVVVRVVKIDRREART